MSYKSYAQGGQFGTYHIELPIKTEINEDLRAAGNFTKQMERSQKYREKWASSYLSALNEKSNVERQNRDDNFEFAQKNYKAIYEGEQREFDGRLDELKREQAKAANAEPGILEKLAPLLLQGAQIAAGMLAETAAAEHTAKVENINRVADSFDRNGIGNIFTVRQDFLSLAENEQIALAQQWEDKTGIPNEIIRKVLHSSGKYENTLKHTAARQGAVSVAATMDSHADAGGILHYSAITREDFRTKFKATQDNELFKVLGDGDIKAGKQYFNELPANVRSTVLKEFGKHESEVYRRNNKGWTDGARDAEISYNIRQSHDAVNHPEGAGKGLWLQEQVYRKQHAHKKDGGDIALDQVFAAFKNNPVGKSAHLKEYQQRRREETGNIQGGGHLDNRLSAFIKETEKREADDMHNQNVRAERLSKQILGQVETGIMGAESDRAAIDLATKTTQTKEFRQLDAKVQRSIQKYASGIGINELRNPSIEKKMGLSDVSQKNGVKEGLERILSYNSTAYKDLKKEEVAIAQIQLAAQVKVMDNAWRKNQSSAALANPEMLWRAAVNETIKEQRNDGSLSFNNMKADGTPQDPAKPMTTHLVAGTDFTSNAPHGTLHFDRVETAVDQQGIGVLEDILFEIDPGSLTKSLTTLGTLINKMRANGGEIERRHVQGLLGSRPIREGARAAGIDAADYLDRQGKAHEKKTGIKWPRLGSKVVFNKEDEIRNQKQVDRMFQGYNVPTYENLAITSTQTWQMAPHAKAFVAHLAPGSTAQVARMGNTGNSRGVHYHIGPEVNYGNPQGLIDAKDKTVELGDALADKGSGFTFTNSQVHISADEWRKMTIEEKYKHVDDEQRAHSSRPAGGSHAGIDLVSDLDIPFPLPIVEGSVGDRRDGFGITGTF